MPKNFFLPNKAAIQPSQPENLLKPAKIKELAFCSEPTARRSLKVAEAINYQILPLSIEEGSSGEEILFISQEELALEKLKEIEFLTSKKLKQVSHTSGQDLSAAIYQAYKADDEALEAAKLKLLAKADFNLKSGASLDFLSEALSGVKNIESKFIHRLIEYSIASEASDLHLIPTREGLSLKIRIAGEIYKHEGPVADHQQAKMIVNHLKVLASLKPNESRLPQDGSFYFKTASTTRWLRISTMPTSNGEKVVLRLPKENFVPALADLGFNVFTGKAVKSAINKNSGLILLVGATGSGKTTTLYSIMQELQQSNLSLVSIENPVEIDLPGVDQSSIQPEIGLNYTAALKSLLRQDPDVILIGEIRESSDAEIALQAAQSGHLVLAAVHAGSVLGAISRLRQLGLNLESLLAVLNLVIFQQLISLRGKHPLDIRRKLLTETLLIDTKIREQIASQSVSVNNIHLRTKNYRSQRPELKELLTKGLINTLEYERYYTLS